MDTEILTGVSLTAFFILCGIWHILENERLEKKLNLKTDKNTSQWLTRFAWLRTLQLLAALGFGIVLFMHYDRQLSEARSHIEALMENNRKTQLASRHIAVRQVVNSGKPALSAPPAETAAAGSIDVITPLPEPKDDTIDALYSPEKSDNDPSSSMDDIKRRYEDIFVIHMFLNRCGKVQPGDYETITAALGQELAAVSAPPRLQEDILSSAKGSYKEIYENSPCDDNSIKSLNAQYVTYIKTLAANVAMAQ